MAQALGPLNYFPAYYSTTGTAFARAQAKATAPCIAALPPTAEHRYTRSRLGPDDEYRKRCTGPDTARLYAGSRQLRSVK